MSDGTVERIVVLLSSLFLFGSLSVYRLLFIQYAFRQYLCCLSSVGRSTIQTVRLNDKGREERRERKRTEIERTNERTNDWLCWWLLHVLNHSGTFYFHVSFLFVFMWTCVNVCVCVFVDVLCAASCVYTFFLLIFNIIILPIWHYIGPLIKGVFSCVRDIERVLWSSYMTTLL